MHRLSSDTVPAPQLGVAKSMHHALGFASTSPFRFSAGATSLRLRRLREERSKQRWLDAAVAARRRTVSGAI